MADPAAPWWTGLPVLDHASRARARAAAHETGRVLARAHRPAVSAVPLSAATGRVLAADVHSRCPVPHYTSSAMDGFAVRGAPPWRLLPPDASRHAAAATAGMTLATGQAVRIVTGGVIPHGTDSVVRHEYARLRGDCLEVMAEHARQELAGRHLRPAGAECPEGEGILARGTRLSPAHIALAAVAGIDTLPVLETPRVRAVLTGSEVVSRGVPGPGLVRDAFAPQLPAVVAMLGGAPGDVVRVPDDPCALADAVERAAADGAPVLITTGGTARSSEDQVRAYLETRGHVLIDELDVRPGHPTLLAGVAPATAVLALPGNPLAAMTALTLLGAPLLRGLTGRPLPAPERAMLSRDVPGARCERLVPATRGQDGTWTPCRAVAANMLLGLSRADGLVCVPPQGLTGGQCTDLLPLPWPGERD